MMRYRVRDYGIWDAQRDCFLIQYPIPVRTVIEARGLSKQYLQRLRAALPWGPAHPPWREPGHSVLDTIVVPKPPDLPRFQVRHLGRHHYVVDNHRELDPSEPLSKDEAVTLAEELNWSLNWEER
jgi:hypothetical protein